MKRSMVLVMVLGLVIGSVATAEAKRQKLPPRVERTVEGSYGPYPAPITGCNSVFTPWACLVVDTRRTEAFFTAKVVDAHGQPVFVEVMSSDGRRETFCGETKHPIAFDPGSSLSFHLALENWPGSVGPVCPANRIKTTGTISVTLSNLP